MGRRVGVGGVPAVLHRTFSLRTSWMWEASLEMLFMISEVVASCESKKPTSCRRMACRYRFRIRSTCRSLVQLQQYPSATRKQMPEM